MKKLLLTALFNPLLFGSAFVLLCPQAGLAQDAPTADYDAVRDFDHLEPERSLVLRLASFPGISAEPLCRDGHDQYSWH